MATTSYTQADLDQIESVIRNWSTKDNALVKSIDLANGGVEVYRGLEELKLMAEYVRGILNKNSKLDLGSVDPSPYRPFSLTRSC